MTTRTFRQPRLPATAILIAFAALAAISIAVAIGFAVRGGGSSSEAQSPSAVGAGVVAPVSASAPAEPLTIYVVSTGADAEAFARLLGEHEAISAAVGGQPRQFSIVVVGEAGNVAFWTAAGEVDYARAVGGAPAMDIHDLRAN